MTNKGNADVIILSATAEDILTTLDGKDRGVYGLDILSRINKANKKTNRREIGVGSLYPTLKRMEKEGLIEGRWGEEKIMGEESGGARRRYYKISENGKKSLAATRNYRGELSPENTSFREKVVDELSLGKKIVDELLAEVFAFENISKSKEHKEKILSRKKIVDKFWDEMNNFLNN
jgi:PadR family transcriptional regulator, regulatory protein PadR